MWQVKYIGASSLPRFIDTTGNIYFDYSPSYNQFNLAKINNSGTLVWNKTWQINTKNYVYPTWFASPDGTYLIASIASGPGTGTASDQKYAYIKISTSNGSIISTLKTYSGFVDSGTTNQLGAYQNANSVSLISDNNDYYSTNYIISSATGNKVWGGYTKYDSSMNILYTQKVDVDGAPNNTWPYFQPLSSSQTILNFNYGGGPNSLSSPTYGLYTLPASVEYPSTANISGTNYTITNQNLNPTVVANETWTETTPSITLGTGPHTPNDTFYSYSNNTSFTWVKATLI
jgi:hypothetical protein